jgi:hypothetical protein
MSRPSESARRRIDFAAPARLLVRSCKYCGTPIVLGIVNGGRWHPLHWPTRQGTGSEMRLESHHAYCPETAMRRESLARRRAAPEARCSVEGCRSACRGQFCRRCWRKLPLPVRRAVRESARGGSQLAVQRHLELLVAARRLVVRGGKLETGHLFGDN